MLDLSEVTVTVGPRTILKGLNFSLAAGQVLGIVGCNQIERETLLRLLTGEMTPRSGSVKLGGKELRRQPLAELARRCAYLPRRPAQELAASVLDIVRTGRAPHRSLESPRMGLQVAERALDFTGGTPFAARPYTSLSSGQQRRIQLARRLAQIWQPLADGDRLLVIDESTIALEPSQQSELLASVLRFASGGVVVVLVLRDLQLAARNTDRLLILERGRMLTYGATPEVLGAAPVTSCLSAG